MSELSFSDSIEILLIAYIVKILPSSLIQCGDFDESSNSFIKHKHGHDGDFFVKSFMKNCKKIYQFKSWNVSFPLALELECNKRNSRIQCTCSCDDTWRVYNVSNVSYRWAIFQLKSVLWKLNL